MSYSSEVLADSPLAYYRLGEASGTVMTDSSGNARDGTYANVALATTGLLTGSSDTAATFDGASSHGDVPFSASWMDPASFTLEAWIKATSTGTHSILDRDMLGQGRAWQFRLNGGNLEFIKIQGGVVTVAQTASLTDGAAHHVAATYDGTNLRLYIDGSLVKTQALGVMTGTSAPFTIGANRSNTGGSYTAFFAGVIDEAAYYATALSGARLAAHYTAATTAGPISGTLSATLPHLTASASGTYGPTGSIAANLPSLAGGMSGTHTPPGASGGIAATLPSLGGSLAGTYSDTASLAATLPALTATITADYASPPISGTLAATLPALTASINAVEGSDFLIATLPSLQAAMSGISLAIVGTDTTVGSFGYSYAGSGVLDYDPPVTPEPAHGGRAHVRRIHRSLPTPTLTDGSPR